MKKELLKLKTLYEKQLLDGELSFWLQHGMDSENGGIYTSLDRDGSLLDTDKSVWFQGRALWVFATAYEIYKKEEYLQAATSLVNFIEKHCFDKTDGRMYFRVSKDGKPVQKRIRYFFSETFTIIGFAKYARITNDNTYSEKAYKLLEFVEKLRTTEGMLTPKYLRETKGFGEPMILLNVLSELRLSLPEKTDWINSYMDRLLEEIKTYFIKDDLKLVLEQVDKDGNLDGEHFEGRLLNPGHAIEGAWFIMNEGITREREDLINLGLKMLSWMWDVGWDSEYGGIIHYRDALNKNLSEYHHDMKFWWPQCEAAIATLMAYSLTKEEEYLEKFNLVNDYIQNHFIDHEVGGWFGYLHRDGSLSTPIKGNMFKGPFHTIRMYFKCIELIDTINEQ